MMRVGWLFLVLLLTGLGAGVEPALACPNCKTTVAGEPGGMANGYAISILIMLLTPASIVAAWWIGIRRLMRQMQGQ